MQQNVFGKRLYSATTCSWGVKAGMVRVSVADKTVWIRCYTQAISEHFWDKRLIIKRYINSPVYFTYRWSDIFRHRDGARWHHSWYGSWPVVSGGHGGLSGGGVTTACCGRWPMWRRLWICAACLTLTLITAFIYRAGNNTLPVSKQHVQLIDTKWWP